MVTSLGGQADAVISKRDFYLGGVCVKQKMFLEISIQVLMANPSDRGDLGTYGRDL